MPLLFLIVVSVLVFLAIIILMAIAAASERAQLRRIHFDPAAQPFALPLSKAFHAEQAPLWSTQIDALQLIASAGMDGLEYDRVYREYQKTARAFPELYEGCGFAQWLFFLQRLELVALTSYRIKITAYGREFLNYCVQVSMAA
jgi:hypothetical protein